MVRIINMFKAQAQDSDVWFILLKILFTKPEIFGGKNSMKACVEWNGPPVVPHDSTPHSVAKQPLVTCPVKGAEIPYAPTYN